MEPPASTATFELRPGVQWPELGALPRCLALPPLYDHLVTRSGLGIRPLGDDGQLAVQAVPANYQAIDCELWAQRFLGDLDRFVSAPMASALCRQPALRDTLMQALGCTLSLADVIAAGLQPVFDAASGQPADDPNGAQGLASARALLRRQLGDSLLAAYRSAVVVQYELQASLPWTGTPGLAPLALHGPAGLDGSSGALRFAAARTGLAPGDRFATFIAQVDAPARHRWVGGQLQYACTHAEFGLPSAGMPPGCEAPSGPCFVPLQGPDQQPAALQPGLPGALQVPVPLRSFPALPSIREQAALSTHAMPAGLAQMPLWTYALSCTHEFAAQDSVQITVDFNDVAPSVLQGQSPAACELFDALAQYVAVADTLWTLLEPLAEPGAVVASDSPGVNAANTFVQLAGAVATHWSICRPPHAGQVVPHDRHVADQDARFVFQARVSYAQDGNSIVGVSLQRGQAQPGSGDAWPGVEVVLPEGPVSLQAQGTSSDTMVYRPQPGTTVAALDQQTLRLAWADINVSAYQNARARILTVRNQHLLYDPAQPDNPVLPTHPRLLLKTAEVRAASSVTPLIQCREPQVIQGADLAKALADAVQMLFPPAHVVDKTTASWGVVYVYELARDSQSPANSLLGRTPVALYPRQALDGAPVALAAAVQAWKDNHHPASAGGGWLFELVLYSGLERSERPLFSAELLYRLG